jgi:simple sugar transport system permease protein
MIKIEVQNSCPRYKAITFRLIAILLALIVGGIFILCIHKNPFTVYFSMIQGAFGTHYRVTETITKTVPMLLCSLGIAVAFKLKFWNIGAEGQLMIGGVVASYVALNYGNLPSYILIPLMLIAGAAAGAIWGGIPAVFRAKFRTNETIFTLMLNYIALKIIIYLQYGPWRDPNALGFPKIPNFSANAVLPRVLGIHCGWIIALVATIIMYIFMKYSKRGYEISVVGESENTARYAGMNVSRVIITTMLISGGLCGLAGVIEVSGVSKTLSEYISGGVGYTAITTAWLSGLNPLIMVVVCFFFAAMVQGGSYIQMAQSIPQSVALLLQSTILFFVLGSEFFIRYKVTFCKAEKKGAEDND